MTRHIWKQDFQRLSNGARPFKCEITKHYKRFTPSHEEQF